jgi:hypothetical protein
MAIEAQHSLNEPGMKGRSIVLGGRWLTHILAAKGLDGGDRVLAKSVAEQLIMRCGCGEARKNSHLWKGKGAIVWRL